MYSMKKQLGEIGCVRRSFQWLLAALSQVLRGASRTGDPHDRPPACLVRPSAPHGPRAARPFHRRDPLVRIPRVRRAGLACTCVALWGMACGGSSGSSPNTIATSAYNVSPVFVDYGPPNAGGYINGLFATVTVCVPGSTSQCQSIDNVLVDTGSSGLRLLGSVLTLSLPAWTDASGTPLAECGQFLSGSIWGPLQSADFSIANEQATNLAIQVIDESTYPLPASCTGTDISTPDLLGANGLLGVNSFLQDCGPACAAGLGNNSENPGMYYACSSAAADGCQPAVAPVAQQVSNPVAFFAPDSDGTTDNNGSIIELPAIPAEGAPSVTGSLVFGIGTRENNGLGRATIIQLDDTGSFLTKYPSNGSEFSAFIDSGSNAIYFLDSGTTGIPDCPGEFSDFYCPSSTLDLSARVQDTYGLAALNVNFSVANAVTLFEDPTTQNNLAYDNLGGPSITPQSGASGTGNVPAYFDWGLPFHFGRNVFAAIEGQATPGGAGPFVAF